MIENPITVMDYKEIFWLSSGNVPRAFHVAPSDKFENATVMKLAKGEIRPEKPIKWVQYLGKMEPYDVIGTGWGMIKIFSKKIIDILEQNHITGWTTFPVEIYDKNMKEILGYCGFSVTGRCGPIIDSMSVREFRHRRVPQGLDYYAWIGEYFDEKTWDGTDMFMPEGTVAVFVTKKVKDLIEQAKCKNISFEPITEIENTHLFTQVEFIKE